MGFARILGMATFLRQILVPFLIFSLVCPANLFALTTKDNPASATSQTAPDEKSGESSNKTAGRQNDTRTAIAAETTGSDSTAQTTQVSGDADGIGTSVQGVAGDTGASGSAMTSITRENVIQDGSVKGSEIEAVVPEQGKADVTERGSFLYNYSIMLPKGLMMPSISITHDSQMGNGLLGIGSRLSGFPTIERIDCGQGINYAGRDCYAFNPAGWDTPSYIHNRLVSTGGNSYQTADWSLNRFEKSAETCGDDKCFWVMKVDGNTYYLGGDGEHNASRDGGTAWAASVWEYGNYVSAPGGGGRGIARWQLYKVVDIHGNYYQVNYTHINGISYPETIEYTKNSTANLPKEYIVKFEYEGRNDNSPYPNNFGRRLKQIKVMVGATDTDQRDLIKKYVLRYDCSPASNRSRLISIQEQGSDCTADPPAATDFCAPEDIGSSCPNGTKLPATVFTWSENTASRPFSLLTVPGTVASLPPTRSVFTDLPFTNLDDSPAQHLVGDVNGDGRDDLVVSYSGRHYMIPLPMHPPVPNTLVTTQAARLAYYRGYNYIIIYYGSDNGLQQPVLFEDFGDDSRWWVEEIRNDLSIQNLFLGDYNGDGIKDLFFLSHDNLCQAGPGCGATTATLKIAFGTSAGLTPFVSGTPISIRHKSELGKYFSLGQTFGSSVGTTSFSDPADWNVFPMDINGDGLTDLFSYDPSGEILLYAMGNRTNTTSPSINPLVRISKDTESYRSYFDPLSSNHYVITSLTGINPVDINGDGYDDIIFTVGNKFRRDADLRGDPRLSVYYLFGSPTGFTPHFDQLAPEKELFPTTAVRGLPQGLLQRIDNLSSFDIDPQAPADLYYQTLTGDFNADHRADLLFLNRGFWDGTNARQWVDSDFDDAMWINWIHVSEYQHFYAPTYKRILGDLNRDGIRSYSYNGRRTPFNEGDIVSSQNDPIPGRNAQPPRSIMKYPSPWTLNQSQWQNHPCDFNGDGFTDLISFYRGIHGGVIEEATGGVNGVSTSSFRLHPQNTNDPQLDGSLVNGQWVSATADVNGDHVCDLVFAYANGRGENAYFGYSLGGANTGSYAQAGGLGAIHDLPTFQNHYGYGRITQLLRADINGDGIDDIIAPGRTPSDPIKYFMAANQKVDVVTNVTNGLGGSLDIEYKPVSQVTNAIKPDSPYCANIRFSNTCLGFNNFSRLMATRLTSHDGRGQDRTTNFEYENGRYLHAAPKYLRTDLGFEKISKTNEQTKSKIITTYFQDQPFDHHPKQVQALDGNGRLVSDVNNTYDVVHPHAGVDFVRLTRQIKKSYELGILEKTETTDLIYDHFGFVTSSTDCIANDCVVTSTNYTHVAKDWLLGRVNWVKQEKKSNHLILDWQRNLYAGNSYWKLSQQDKLLCADAEACFCSDATGASCFSAPVTAPVHGVIQTQHQRYDDANGAYGNLEHVEDGQGRAMDFTYDPNFKTHVATTTRVVHKNPGPDLTLVTSTLYDTAGRPTQTTDANGGVTTYTYDNLGRILQALQPIGGVTYEYRNFGNPETQSVYSTILTGQTVSVVKNAFGRNVNQTLSLTQWTNKYFDGFGTAYNTESMGDDNKTIVSSRREFFDPAGSGEKIVLFTEPHFEHEAENKYELRQDTLGRLKTVKRITPMGAKLIRSFDYQPLKLLITDAKKGVTTYQFNARGLLTSITDSEAKTTSYAYDSAYRVKQITLPLDKVSPGANSNLLTFQYDGWGRIVLATDPWIGKTTFGYSDFGPLQWSTDALNRKISLAYDALDRVVTKTLNIASGSGGATPSFVTQSPPLATFTYDDARVPYSKGRLTKVEDSSGSTEFTYDVLGNVLSNKIIINGLSGNYTYQYAYDLLNRPISMTLPDQTLIEYPYSPAGNLAEVRVAQQTQAQFSNYNALGQLGTRIANGITADYLYNEDNYLDTLHAENVNRAVLMDLEYHYDELHNIRKISDNRQQKITGVTNTDATQIFEYDSLSRLKSARGVYGTLGFAYDSIGNITKKGNLTLQYDEKAITGQIISPNLKVKPRLEIKAAFDPVGNMITRIDKQNSRRFVYDAENHLIEVWDQKLKRKFLDLVYNYGGERVKKIYYDPQGIATTTYYIADNYELRERGNARTTTKQITAPGVGLISTITQGSLNGQVTLATAKTTRTQPMTGSSMAGSPEGTLFTWPDHIGSSAVISAFDDTLSTLTAPTGVNSKGGAGTKTTTKLLNTGVELSRYAYLPFGEVDKAHATGQNLTAIQYTGQKNDEEFGLMYYHARYYDPFIGRFISADNVIPGNGLNPQGFNRYAYVKNNPIMYTDPTGHKYELGEYGPSEDDKLMERTVQTMGAGLTMATGTVLNAARAGFHIAVSYLFGGGGKTAASKIGAPVAAEGVRRFVDTGHEQIPIENVPDVQDLLGPPMEIKGVEGRVYQSIGDPTHVIKVYKGGAEGALSQMNDLADWKQMIQEAGTGEKLKVVNTVVTGVDNMGRAYTMHPYVEGETIHFQVPSDLRELIRQTFENSTGGQSRLNQAAEFGIRNFPINAGAGANNVIRGADGVFRIIDPH